MLAAGLTRAPDLVIFASLFWDDAYLNWVRLTASFLSSIPQLTRLSSSLSFLLSTEPTTSSIPPSQPLKTASPSPRSTGIASAFEMLSSSFVNSGDRTCR